MKKIVYLELIAEMAKRGETRRSVAKLLGISNATVSRKLSNETEWTISEIEKLCEYFDKDYYTLFKKTDKN